MKNLILLTALLLPLTMFAKIWIVDSNPGSASKDFVNLQEAHDGASAGDTLYLIGSGVSYITASANISKRLVIIGPGYFFDNPETQVSLQPAFLTLTSCDQTIVFSEGSAGSVMIGLTIRGTVFIATNNIMIKRNHFTASSNGACNGENNIRLVISGSVVSVVQNYFQATPGPSIYVTDGLSNVFIRNNYISNSCGIPGSPGCPPGVRALISLANTGIELTNNIIQGSIAVSNAVVRNNIFATNPVQFITNFSIVTNNLSNQSWLPSGNGNINGANLTNIFLGTGTLDGRWKLKDGSPAIGSGYNGTDMGMFGGAEPYVLSGIPPIPTIYGLEAPLTGEKNTGLPIEIKAKSNN